MLFDFSAVEDQAGDHLILSPSQRNWGVASEHGRLTDVMLSAPNHLAIVPCNSVSEASLAQGLSTCTLTALAQHRALRDAFEAAGVACHMVPAHAEHPDMSFTRDSSIMTPWGLLGARLAEPHRRDETVRVLAAARRWGVPVLGTVEEGYLEGGDVALVRPGTVAIGWSGARSDAAGAAALARLFEARGWVAITTRIEPRHLHLDCLFGMLDSRRALACTEALEPRFVARMEALGIELIPITATEVDGLGANVLSLGDGRVFSAARNARINTLLTRRGYRVTALPLDQFARCGGGVHCLTMPLARH